MERVNERTVVKIEEDELLELIEEKMSEFFGDCIIEGVDFVETTSDGNYLKVILYKEVEF